jgi:hypothetical protein
MKRSLKLLVATLAVMCSIAYAELPGVDTITRADDPLVKELESDYARFAAATRKGDLATFRSFRTAKANQAIPSNATGKDLKEMADMMAPSLAGYRFVQLDTRKDQARLAYKLEKKGELTVRVMMFEKENGGWKMGDIGESAHIGQLPSVSVALEKALANPDVQFRK